MNAVFPHTSEKIVVQRVGDPNQQIFDLPDSGSGAAEPFPHTDPTRCLGIPNSYRFGSQIAALASPLAVQPVGSSGLCGIGPKSKDSPAQPCRNAIFVFPDDNTDGVIKVYGAYAIDVLGQELAAKGPVTAVGHIHQDNPEVTPGHAHYPKTVSHYWDGYSVEKSRKAPHPRTLVQYISAAQAQVADRRILSPGVDKIASGVLELARRMGDIGDLRRKGRPHRAVIAVLANDPTSLTAYLELLRKFLVDRTELIEAEWNRGKDGIMAIATALCTRVTDTAGAARFLAWPKDNPSLEGTGTPPPADAGANVLRFSDGNGNIDIRLGSIHSMKGQTHLATLLLSTNWYGKHSAIRIMPWLLGKEANGAEAGKQDLQRLLHTYVAMTRPSHLLCLAVPRSALGKGKTADQAVAVLKGKGWRLAELIEGAVQWRD